MHNPKTRRYTIYYSIVLIAVSSMVVFTTLQFIHQNPIQSVMTFFEGFFSLFMLSRNEEVSKQIGEKMRSNDSGNAIELQELRQKIEGSTIDPKKKKSTKKKDQKTNWYNFDAISIYDGVGIKGELELYFKEMERTKSELERTTKVKQAVDELVNKGLKKDMECVLLLNDQLPAEIAFTPSGAARKKFAFKAIFDVPIEVPYKIKI